MVSRENFADGMSFITPEVLIHQGDMSRYGFPHFVDTPEKLNAMGRMLSACSRDTKIFIDWHVNFFARRVGDWRGRRLDVAIYGHPHDVREAIAETTFLLSEVISHVAQRQVVCRNGIFLTAVYLDDNPIGFHFDSVFLVGKAEPHEPIRIGNIRSGYRGVVRAQYRRATDEDETYRERLDRLMESTMPPAQTYVPYATGGVIGPMSFGSNNSAPQSEKKEEIVVETPETPLVEFPERRLFLKDGE